MPFCYVVFPFHSSQSYGKLLPISFSRRKLSCAMPGISDFLSMPQSGQNPVTGANMKRQNPVRRAMLFSQFPWVCPPLCAWGTTWLVKTRYYRALKHKCPSFQRITSYFIPVFEMKFAQKRVRQYPGSEVPDIRKPSAGRVSEASEDDGHLAEWSQNLVPMTCQHLIKVTPACVQHNHKSLYLTSKQQIWQNNSFSSWSVIDRTKIIYFNNLIIQW